MPAFCSAVGRYLVVRENMAPAIGCQYIIHRTAQRPCVSSVGRARNRKWEMGNRKEKIEKRKERKETADERE